ncbi:hypothetical protein N566_05395 [Streptomycetaceae bacterium MP113-05]|nr:hypothetical protein N566_05395 [Streptomycetaceae bacterium MP113-05]
MLSQFPCDSEYLTTGRPVFSGPVTSSPGG